jgi:hypothetical protein
MGRRWNVVGPFLATVLLTLSAASRTETQITPRLFDATTAHGVSDGVPLEPADVFTPDETPIYVSSRCDGCAIGTIITSSWWYQEREPPLRFAHAAVTVQMFEDFGEFHYDLAPGKRWSIGGYRIELRIDDVLAAEVPFRVAVNRSRTKMRTVAVTDKTLVFAPAATRSSRSQRRER